MKKRNKLIAMLAVISMLVLMFGVVTQAADLSSNYDEKTYNGYKLTLTATCTRTQATSKVTYGGNAAIYAYGKVSYKNKYSSGTSGGNFTYTMAEDGMGSVTASYAPGSSYQNISNTAWGKVGTVKAIGDIAAYAGLT